MKNLCLLLLLTNDNSVDEYMSASIVNFTVIYVEKKMFKP